MQKVGIVKQIVKPIDMGLDSSIHALVSCLNSTMIFRSIYLPASLSRPWAKLIALT